LGELSLENNKRLFYPLCNLDEPLAPEYMYFIGIFLLAFNILIINVIWLGHPVLESPDDTEEKAPDRSGPF